MELKDLLNKLAIDGGTIVCSSECSEMEIAIAKSCNKMYVDNDGIGYVWRAKTTNEAKALPMLDVSQQSELLFEFNEWVANDRRSTTVKQLVDGFIKEKFK